MTFSDMGTDSLLFILCECHPYPHKRLIERFDTDGLTDGYADTNAKTWSQHNDFHLDRL